MVHRLVRVAVVTLVAVGLALGAHVPGGGATTGAPGHALQMGVIAGGAPTDLSGVATFEHDAGLHAAVVSFYEAWTVADFPASAASAVAARGSVPLLTWEPWDPGQGTNQPAYRLATITSGAHDAYIAHWAQQIKTWGRPLFLRFAHEMNGSWYPWSEQRNGNGPGDFVRAWNHVQAVFAANGVTNATWVWSPNVSYPGATEMQELYPGDAAVGAVGIDGYNSGTAPGGTGWVSFSDLFGPTLAHVRSFSHRPLLISEIASTESGGNKAAWITDMFSRLAAQPDVLLFVWFNSNKETDWRIESSPAATQAFAAGVAANVSP